MTICSAQVEPPCGKRATVAFVLDGDDGEKLRLERCAEHAEMMRAALQSLVGNGAWTEEPITALGTQP
jgi:hypothetical protein